MLTGVPVLFCSMHCWVSFSGFSKVYFEYSNQLTRACEENWMMVWLKDVKAGNHYGNLIRGALL